MYSTKSVRIWGTFKETANNSVSSFQAYPQTDRQKLLQLNTFSSKQVIFLDSFCIIKYT